MSELEKIMNDFAGLLNMSSAQFAEFKLIVETARIEGSAQGTKEAIDMVDRVRAAGL